MGLGILSPSTSAAVPGTSRIIDSSPQLTDVNQPLDPRLKYDTTGSVPIILIPQPTDDPNDPLNWPLWRRDVILLILSTMSVIASTLSPLLAANTVTLSVYFNRDFTQMALLTGYHLLGVGVAGLIFVASARVWGKRHLYLLGTILIVVSSAWGGHSGTNYKSLLWARVVQGVGLAPFEALVNASVGDLYHVHQRGKRMALSNLALFGGAFFTPVIVGKMTHSIGWEWTFWLIAIFSGVCLPFIFFFCPETAYPRAVEEGAPLMDRLEVELPHYDPSQPNQDGVATTPEKRALQSTSTSQPPSLEKQRLTPSPMAESPIPIKKSYLSTLSPFPTQRLTSTPFLSLLLRPVPLLFHPSVLWAMLTQGTLIGWTVMIGVVLAAIFLGPPLWFSEVETGYMYAGPFIGAILGFLLAGALADWSARWMAKRNGGVYEPEFRLLLVIPQMVLGCAGLYGFGASAVSVHSRSGWFAPEFCFTIEVMGMVLGAVASSLYIVDAHSSFPPLSFLECSPISFSTLPSFLASKVFLVPFVLIYKYRRHRPRIIHPPLGLQKPLFIRTHVRCL